MHTITVGISIVTSGGMLNNGLLMVSLGSQHYNHSSSFFSSTAIRLWQRYHSKLATLVELYRVGTGDFTGLLFLFQPVHPEFTVMYRSIAIRRRQST